MRYDVVFVALQKKKSYKELGIKLKVHPLCRAFSLERKKMAVK